MIMRRLAIALLLAAVFGGAMYTTLGCGGSAPTSPPQQAPPATISGIVTNAVTGAPVAGALVAARIIRSEYNTQTDATGHYTTFSDTGTITVFVTASGYQTFSKAINVQDGGNTLNIQLQPAS
ncbi:MAG: CarboxypepD reg-like domain [Acidobacteriota bacterium]|jgi:hypothetical protein|nr:CarboxypepD reg-like domain [Acidobacteriota bacterium]